MLLYIVVSFIAIPFWIMIINISCCMNGTGAGGAAQGYRRHRLVFKEVALVDAADSSNAWRTQQGDVMRLFGKAEGARKLRRAAAPGVDSRT